MKIHAYIENGVVVAIDDQAHVVLPTVEAVRTRLEEVRAHRAAVLEHMDRDLYALQAWLDQH